MINTYGKTIKCIARRMQGGANHEHISRIWWKNIYGLNDLSSMVKDCISYPATREEIIAFIENGGSVWCEDETSGKRAKVCVHRNSIRKYVQAISDGRKSNLLLSLPEW